jgi:hypothetical protein
MTRLPPTLAPVLEVSADGAASRTQRTPCWYVFSDSCCSTVLAEAKECAWDRADSDRRKGTVPSERWVQLRAGIAQHRRKGSVSDLSTQIVTFFFVLSTARGARLSGAPDA